MTPCLLNDCSSSVSSSKSLPNSFSLFSFLLSLSHTHYLSLVLLTHPLSLSCSPSFLYLSFLSVYLSFYLHSCSLAFILAFFMWILAFSLASTLSFLSLNSLSCSHSLSFFILFHFSLFCAFLSALLSLSSLSFHTSPFFILCLSLSYFSCLPTLCFTPFFSLITFRFSAFLLFLFVFSFSIFSLSLSLNLLLKCYLQTEFSFSSRHVFILLALFSAFFQSLRFFVWVLFFHSLFPIRSY